MLLHILSWIAIFILSISYWFQDLKRLPLQCIKEVRDISVELRVFLLLLTIEKFAILAFTSL